MAVAVAKTVAKDYPFVWEGKDKAGKVVRGEMRASGEAVVNATLRRQGINVSKVKKQRMGGGGKVTDKDITLFSRQLATMMKAGVPLLQAFDIVGKGHTNPGGDQTAGRHQDRGRNRDQSLAAGLPKIPAVLRRAVLQPGGRPANRPASWRACSIAWRPTRKRSSPSNRRSSRRCSTRSPSSWWPL